MPSAWKFAGLRYSSPEVWCPLLRILQVHRRLCFATLFPHPSCRTFFETALKIWGLGSANGSAFWNSFPSYRTNTVMVSYQSCLSSLDLAHEHCRTDDEAELICGRLLPARLSTIAETLQIIATNTDIVASQLQAFESGYRMPDFFIGRDILSKDPFVDGEIPGRQYCQCSLCHGIGSFWNYPFVRGYGVESKAAQWMSQWAARCICGGSWV
jgi:hypothetical protein